MLQIINLAIIYIISSLRVVDAVYLVKVLERCCIRHSALNVKKLLFCKVYNAFKLSALKTSSNVIYIAVRLHWLIDKVLKLLPPDRS